MYIPSLKNGKRLVCWWLAYHHLIDFLWLASPSTIFINPLLGYGVFGFPGITLLVFVRQKHFHQPFWYTTYLFQYQAWSLSTKSCLLRFAKTPWLKIAHWCYWTAEYLLVNSKSIYCKRYLLKNLISAWYVKNRSSKVSLLYRCLPHHCWVVI